MKNIFKATMKGLALVLCAQAVVFVWTLLLVSGKAGAVLWAVVGVALLLLIIPLYHLVRRKDPYPQIFYAATLIFGVLSAKGVEALSLNIYGDSFFGGALPFFLAEWGVGIALLFGFLLDVVLTLIKNVKERG